MQRDKENNHGEHKEHGAEFLVQKNYFVTSVFSVVIL